jgi:hypothetical protein
MSNAHTGGKAMDKNGKCWSAEEVKQHLADARAANLSGSKQAWVICQTKQGNFVPWPNICTPKTYRVVEVLAAA